MLQRIGLLRDEDESKNSNAFFNIDMLGESEAIEDDQLKGVFFFVGIVLI